MKINITITSGLENVQKAMLATAGITSVSCFDNYKNKTSRPLNEKTFQTMLLGKHSPIEEMKIWIEAIVPERVHTHIVRHEEIGKYVATSRPDIPWSVEPEEGMRILCMSINLKRLIEIMQQRLCYRSWSDTRLLFKRIRELIIQELPCIEYMLNPLCIWYGFCPEGKQCCKYINSIKAMAERSKLKSIALQLH